MAKAHESYDAGQFLTGSLTHFTIGGTIDAKHLVETVGTRATTACARGGGGVGKECKGGKSQITPLPKTIEKE